MVTVFVAAIDLAVVTVYVSVFVANATVPAPIVASVPTAGVPLVPGGTVIVTVLIDPAVAVLNVYVYETPVADVVWLVAVHVVVENDFVTMGTAAVTPASTGPVGPYVATTDG
jgi:hypothetical protein